MSTPAEHLEKPKRKYTKRAKPIPDSPAEFAHIPSEDVAPTHERPCCVVLKRFMEKSQFNDEMVHRVVECGKPSTWVPRIVFKGHELRLRKNEEGKPEQYRGSKLYTMPVDWQPVCDAHKAAIEKNPGVILTNQWINQQTRSFIDSGFPPPEPPLTRFQWRKYVPEEVEPQTEVLDVLIAIANERALLAIPENVDYGAIPNEDADASR